MFKRISLATLLLFALTGCEKMVIGKLDETKLKETKASWGVPQSRPVVWGFTGIPRDCKDCPASETKK